MANTKIVLNRQSDLILDNALITNPQGIVLTDISGVSEAVASINEATSVAISSEAADRVDGDLSLEANLSSELVDRAAAVLAEASDRVAGDLSLQNQIDFITNNIDDAAIDSLTEIVAAFQAADGDINGAITTLAGAAGADLSTEVARAEAAEGSLDAAKLNLAGGTMSGDIEMGGANLNNAFAVRATQVHGGEVFTDSFNTESGGAINMPAELDFTNGGFISNLPAPANGGDAANKTYVDAADASLAAAVSAEESARLDAGTSVSAEVSAEVFDRVAADESLAAELSSEIESLALTDETTIELNAADNTIKLKDTIAAPASGIRTFMGEVDVESVLKVAGVDVMATLSTEVSRAEFAELSIVDLLGTNLTAGDDYLQSQLDNLAQTDGLTLDVDLTNNTIKLKDTVSAPITGIRTFEGLINVGAEPSLDAAFGDLSLVTKKFVEDADASIMSIVNNVISNIDAPALDSLTEIVAAFQAADGDLNGAITNMANVATTDLNAEISTRIAAVESLDDKIDAFPLTDDLTIEVDEVDNTIKLKDTVAAPLSGIRTFEGEVDVQSVLKVAGVDVMAAISTEESIRASNHMSAQEDRLAGDLSLETNLSSEIVRAESADASLEAAKLNLSGGTMTGDIDMDGNDINNVEAIRTNAVILNAFEGVNGDFIVSWSHINMRDENKITGLAAPTNDGDATNKLYVDSVTSNLSSDLSTGLSAEIARAEAAELSLAEELSSEVSYLISNIDITDVDSFSEIVRDLSSEIVRAESADLSLDVAKLNLSGGTMTGTIEMSNNSLYNASEVTAVHVETNTLASKGGINSSIDLYANLDARSVKSIINLPAPTNDGDAANKDYVDSEVSSEVSTEVARAEAAEASIALDFANVYAKHVVVNETPDDIIATFTLATAVREGSELVYVNGLLFDSEDYTVNLVDGKVASVTFVIIPSVGDKVRAYGVC